MNRLGVPLDVARDIVGHASLDTTSLYAAQELSGKIDAMGLRRRRGLSFSANNNEPKAT